ncbi:hypothetical protein PV325_010425 [Microctonus aethiopoides]|nr:hypothetical protein PV325_010425 [Microctonus aethiopoides]
MSSSSIGSPPVDGHDTVGIQGRLLPKKKQDKYSSTYVPQNRFSRYTTALTNLVPVRFKRIPGSEIPIDKIGLFSSVSFSWLSEYVTAGWKNGLRDKPIPTIATQESCQINGPRIHGLWHSHIVKKGQAGASVPKIAWQFIQTRVLIASLIYFLGMIIALCSPILILQKIILATEDKINVTSIIQININNTKITSINSTNSLENSTINNINKSIINNNDEIKQMIIIDDVIIFTHISILIIAELASYFLIAWSSSLNLRTATRLRTACLSLAYKKLIKSSIKYKTPVHETLTYFIPDSKTLYELITNGPQIFSGPLILFFSSLYIWYSMGHWALIGIGVLIALYLSAIIGAYLTNSFATSTMDYSLKRMYLLEEFIKKIYLAKVAQWDRRFVELIHSMRKKELGEMKYGTMTQGWSLCMIHIIPIITISAITMSYLLTNKQFISANYITCLVLIFLNLKNCIRGSYFAMSSISRGIASLKNLKTVLILNDTVRYTDKPIDKNLAITINDGQFSWDAGRSSNLLDSGSSLHLENQIIRPTSSYQLTGINFYAPKGKLIGICGEPGSGKSSLLLAIMGQLNYVKGHVTIDGTMSYVPENVCLFEGTVKENIIMGDIFDSTWYYKTIQACHLSEEINQLPGTDDTDIYQSHLSVIQKQKIALARAVYSNRNINLFDNPLKDANTEEALKIFEKSIIQILKDQTVIIITDRIELLRKCDTIYLMKAGKIIEEGKHDELIEMNKDYADLIDSLKIKRRQSTRELLLESTKKKSSITSCTSGSILDMINKDERESEIPSSHSKYGIGPQVDYRPYNNDAGECLSKFVCGISLLYSIPIAIAPLIFFYIIQKTLTNTMYIAIILASVVAFIIIIGSILIVIYTKDAYSAAKSIHERWLQKIYRAHISVFNVISPSILLNIFSRELQEVDYVLPKLKIIALMHMGISAISVITLGILSPWLIIPGIFFIFSAIFYKFYARKLLLTLDELSIESVIPIYNHAINAVDERVIIQAYRKEREFAKTYYKHCNTNATYEFMFEACKLWIEYRIKLLSALTLGTVMIICATVNGIKERHEVIGLAFICTLQMIHSVIHLIEALIDAGRSLRTVNIADNYVQNIPQEIKTNDDHRKEWPLIPSIHFQNVLFTSHSTNYEPLNFSIYAGEKVAIHGTDSEMKQDLAKALMQFEEVFSGNILIGSMNIADIHIDTLRQHVDYIPAIPILFDGSIRYNLEPNNRKTNNEIMAVLQKFNLWDKISKLDDKLAADANNAFFSITEKKLLFLARIYLNTYCFSRNIIILENIGPNPEIINSLLQDMFKEFTIIVLSNETTWSIQRAIKLPNEKIMETSNN